VTGSKDKVYIYHVVVKMGNLSRISVWTGVQNSFFFLKFKKNSEEKKKKKKEKKKKKKKKNGVVFFENFRGG
jgi:hypothetical protein